MGIQGSVTGYIMKTPIKIRYIILVVLAMLGLALWFRLPYMHQVAVLPQAVKEVDIAKTFTGDYLAGYMASKQGDWQKAAELFEQSRERAPENTALLENAYTFKLLYGEVGDAMKLARQQPEATDTSSVSVILRATDAVMAKDYTKANQLLGRIMPGKQEEISVGTVISPLLLAWVKLGEGKTEEGLALLQQMKEREMVQALASYQLGLAYEMLGRNKEAETEYNEALEGDIKPYHFVLAVGSFYARRHNADAAKAVFEGYLSSNPASELFAKEEAAVEHGDFAYFGNKLSIIDGWVEVLMEGVRIAYQSNLNDEGIAYLQLVNYLKPVFPQSIMLLAGHYEEVNDYTRANIFYSRIPASSSFYWESRINRARNDYKSGHKEEAEKALQALVQEKPKDYAAPLEFAELLRLDSRFQQAASMYETVISRIPKPLSQHWYIYFAQGVAYEQSDQWEKAEKSFQKALDLSPGQPDVSNYLGYSWLMKGKETEKARAMIETAVAARPDDAHVLDSMGWMLFLTGEYAQAIDYLEQAIEAMPYDATVNDHLGDLYWRVGRFKEAHYQWERALHASSPAPEADQIRKITRKLSDGLSGGTATPSPELEQLSNNDK